MRTILSLLILGLVAVGGWFLLAPGPVERESTEISPAPIQKPAPQETGASEQDETAWLALRDKLTGQIEQSTQADPSPEADGLRERIARLSDSSTEAELVAAAGITPEEEAAAREWAHARGFDRESTGYQYYDQETLEALAATGDMYAQQRLGFKAARERDFLRAEVLLKQAAVGGSVFALDLLAFNATSRALEANQNGQKEEARQRLMEAFAWTEIANRRGYDALPAGGFREGSIDRNLKDMGFELSPEDRQRIEKMAERRYQSLERERADRGHDPFDNSTPVLFEKLNRAAETYQQIHSDDTE
ncbi:hypothetical protein [Marinimicrobium agarilyticum]|uniref:hypothetical protein n=1 Tax=Marinimicrobium agarilyticum TaxID=306546 RepID=UPI00041E0576|nr:hypothetical protein [Marinimicrobium agarilyticum]